MHVLSHLSVENKLPQSSFASLFSDVLEHHAPVKQRRLNLARPFITTEIKTHMYQRGLAHQIACNTLYPRDWLVFRNIKPQAKLSLQRAESDFMKNEIQMKKNDPNGLWKLLDAFYQF